MALIHVLAQGIHDHHCAFGDAIPSQYNILLGLPHLQAACQEWHSTIFKYNGTLCSGLVRRKQYMIIYSREARCSKACSSW